jgi:hypothetical protein
MKNRYIIFVATGIELVGIMVACLLIGQKIDETYNLKGLAMIGLSMAGLAGWITQIVFLTKRLEASEGEK